MRLSERLDLPVDPRRAWDVVVDPAIIARTFPGLHVLEVLGDEPVHVGSRLRVVLTVGSAEIGCELEVTELHPGRDLAARSVTGLDVHVAVRVRPHDDGTRIVTRVGYTAPGGFAGPVAGIVALPELRRRTRAMLAGMERVLLDEPPPTRTASSLPGPRTLVHGAVALARTGTLRPVRPDRIVSIARAARRWGATPAGAYAAAAARDPHRLAIVDGDRALTYAELDARTDALAVGLRDRGVGDGNRVLLAARNHRGFVEALVAIGKVGADAVLLNTGFAEPQIRAVTERERPVAVICDADLLDLLDAATGGEAGGIRARVVSAWDDEHEPRSGVRALDDLVVEGAGRHLPRPRQSGRVVLLTSGTTGAPKGTTRGRLPPEAPVGILERIPYRDGSTIHIAPPLFHAWGFANLLLALLLGSTVVLERRFDPEGALRTMSRHGADVLVAVPSMLARILALPPEVRGAYDVSRLRLVASSGSGLPPGLATRWMDAFGDGLHNLYGSTEVGWAAIAGPEDLRAAPDSAGRPPRGSRVRIFTAQDVPLPTHRTGRILVGGGGGSGGYTDGSRPTEIDGMIDTGDLGHLDDLGRLFVLGRSDDMVVTGGENVHPAPIEAVLAEQPGVEEAAVVGVPDDDLGQRLVAHVVPADGEDEPDGDELRSAVRARRPRFEVPQQVVLHDALPRNAAGKILRRTLRDGTW